MTTENSKVIDLNIKKEERILDFADFQKQEIKFDISKLQEAYHQIVKIKKFEDAGVTHFGAISLTQKPGDPDSIKGNKARGIFWTKPDKSGKEVVRDEAIEESADSSIASSLTTSFPDLSGFVQNIPRALLPFIESGSPGFCVKDIAPKCVTPASSNFLIFTI